MSCLRLGFKWQLATTALNLRADVNYTDIVASAKRTFLTLAFGEGKVTLAHFFKSLAATLLE